MTIAPSIDLPLPDVETDRLFLRRFDKTDLDDLTKVFSKKEVWMFPYGRGFTEQETEKFIDTQILEWNKYGFGCWVARLKDTGALIGFVGISIPHFLPEILPAVEIGWRFDPDYWGNGYAIEGAKAALDQSFNTLGLDKVCSAPQTVNPPSSRVCERLGMKFECLVVAEGNDMRGAVDVHLYWITKEEWLGDNRSN